MLGLGIEQRTARMTSTFESLLKWLAYFAISNSLMLLPWNVFTDDGFSENSTT